MAFGISDTYLKGNNEGDEPVKVNVVEPKAEEVKPQEEVKNTTEPKAEEVKPTNEPKPNIEPKAEGTKPTSEQNTTELLEIKETDVLAYFNKDSETPFDSLEAYKQSLIQEKEVIKEINPYEDIIDDYDKKYFQFKKETGLGRKEFDFVQQDISQKSPLDIAIQQIQNETGLTLNDGDAKSYLERKLNIDLSDNQLSVEDQIELNRFVKPYKDQLISQQEKYKATKSEPKPSNTIQEPLYVTQDGRAVTKEAYEQEIKQVKTDYINNIKAGVNSVTSADYNVTIDDNGTKREINLKYDYSEADKHSMLSDASDVDAMINKRYNTENGFSHSQLAEGLWWGNKDNQLKVIKAVVQQARASLIEEMAASDNNENFNPRPINQKTKSDDGYGDMRDAVTRKNSNGFGLKY